MDVKLNAMNFMLAQAKGVRPVTSVSSGHPFAVSAKLLLETLDYEQQNRGWYFNREYNVVFTPDNSGHIVIPDAVLQVRFPAATRSKLNPAQAMRYTIRGKKVWDGMKRTYEIDAPVYLDTITQLPLEDCPIAYVSWLQRKATEALYVAGPVEQSKLQTLRNDTNAAWAVLFEDILRNTEPNILNTPMGARMNGFMATGYRPSGMLGVIA